MSKDCVVDTDGERRRVESPTGTNEDVLAKHVRWKPVSGIRSESWPTKYRAK